MKRAKKRYYKPIEIHAEILKLKRQAVTKLKKAEVIEADCLRMIKAANEEGMTAGQATHLREQSAYEKDKALKLRNAASLIHEKQIPRFIATLQEMETMPMEFIKNDLSVQKAL